MTTLAVAAGLEDQLIALARSEAPREACGLLSRGEAGIRLRRAENAAEDPLTSFAIQPREQFALLAAIDDAGEEFVAIFHSHPRSGPEPSQRDRELAVRWPTIEWVIVGLGGEAPELWVGLP